MVSGLPRQEKSYPVYDPMGTEGSSIVQGGG